VNNSVLGVGAKATEPVIEQIFVAKAPSLGTVMDFERKLYGIRKVTENTVRSAHLVRIYPQARGNSLSGAFSRLYP